jgi:hypothetical protein
VSTLVEEILPTERAVIELHQDQVSYDGNFANGLARLLALLGIEADGKQEADE